MTTVKIITCTRAKTQQEFEQRPIFESLEKQAKTNSNIDVVVVKNNKKGLSVVYNEFLAAANSNEILLFVHDDVVLEDLFLYEKLVKSPYAITGLAGAKTFNKRSQNLAWHVASDKSSHVGEVAHFNAQNGVWTTKFGPTNSRALILDGLFLSCNVKELHEKKVTFDSRFDFHFYDIAFCLRANEQRATCGVLPIRVIHYGLGDSMLTKEWTKSNETFKSVYCI